MSEINKVVFAGVVLLDLTSDTVTEDVIIDGYTGHDAAGNKITGKLKIITVDEELDANSTNPLQNKAIVSALNSKLSSNENAVSATKATKDGSGNVITSTYATKEELSNISFPVKSVNGKTGDVIVDSLPAGTIISFAGNSVPTGFLACDGASVSRTTYADLFTAIGTTYGSGNGSSTFTLPNLNNNSFLEGSGTAGTVKSAGLPNITGEFGRVIPSGNDYDCNGAFDDRSGGGTVGGSAVNLWHLNFDASRCSSIYGNSTTVQPKSVTVKYCIKY